jgi:hypothetical protein
MRWYREGNKEQGWRRVGSLTPSICLHTCVLYVLVIALISHNLSSNPNTFAPVTKFVSIRCIIALVTIEDMEIHQMDIKTAFLNGVLEEEIYMEQPEGSLKKVSILCASFTSHCTG